MSDFICIDRLTEGIVQFTMIIAFLIDNDVMYCLFFY